MLDRPLLPVSAVRQALVVSTGDAGVPSVSPHYDLLTRELVFRFAARLSAGTLYRVELLVPQALGKPGLRAFDGAPLAPGPVPLAFNFVTAGARSRRPASPPVEVEPNCADVAAIFRTACAGGCCHGKLAPAMGLRLGDEDDLVRTALGKVARQTDTGGSIGVPSVSPARFGVAMPILDPGSPATSYLVYKLLLRSENFAPCASGCDAFPALPGADRCLPLSAVERERLREWFVRGEGMPLDPGRTVDGACDDLGVQRHLDCASLRVLTRFLENGTRCD